jgi:hypothetical protein
MTNYIAVPSVCPQLTPVGTTIFQGVHAKDVDAGVNGLVEYFIVPGDGKGLGTDDGVGRNRINVADGVGYFSINLPHQGQVTVNRSLDFERTQRYLVTIVASVRTTILLCYKSMQIARVLKGTRIRPGNSNHAITPRMSSYFSL